MTDSPFQVSITPTQVTMGLETTFTVSVTNTEKAITLSGSSSDAMLVLLPAGDRPEDLTRSLSAAAIQAANQATGEKWTGSKRQGISGTEFIIRPRPNITFEENEAASFDITPVTISNLAAGVSTVMIAGSFAGKPVQPQTLNVTKTEASLKVLSFTAQPQTVGLGQKTKLSWTVIKADYVDIEPGVGSFKTSGTGLSSDSTRVLPVQSQASTCYTAYARAGNDRVAGPPVTVNLAQARVLSFNIDPGSAIDARNAWGDWTEVSLTWNTQYAAQVFLDLVSSRPRVPIQVTPNYPYKLEPGKLLTGGESALTLTLIGEGFGEPARQPLTVRFNPATIHYFKFADLEMTQVTDLVTGQTGTSLNRTGTDERPIWTLDVQGPGGPLRRQIGRGTDALQIAYFGAAPASVKPGQAVTLTWITHGQDQLLLDPGGNAVPTKPDFAPVTHEVHPTETTTYVLKAKKGNEVITSELTVTVSG